MATLGEELLRRGLIREETLRAAERQAAEEGRPLSRVLRELGVPEAVLLEIQAAQYGLSVVRLTDHSPDPGALRNVPAALAAHYGIFPLRRGAGVLTVAVSDPQDTVMVEDLQTRLGCRVERVLAPRDDIREAIRRHYGVGADTVERILAGSPERGVAEIGEEVPDLERRADDASVVRLVDQLLEEAIRDRATDIHFEAHRDGVAIRRRIDGILYDSPVPANLRLLYPAILSRIKLMSGLDIVERRLPQDGRVRVRLAGRSYDLRVSVVPALHGEDVVIRILPSTLLLDLSELGFSEEHRQMLEDFLRRPHGILFVTGPTGSGKSTTLYACLRRLNSRERKIITIEDPVEYELPGITQTQIHPRIGLTFARALRSMLRHDPDIMLVGEVRDQETAEIAVQTAMTGHLVFSTLHTNDAASGAVRLIDMGIEPYLITSTVLVFIAQRLVRTICSECRESYVEAGRTLFRGRGCPRCRHTGYFGRMAICEFLPLLPSIQELILQRASVPVLRRKADELGLRTLRDDGWDKVQRGLTTLEELLRVTTL